jgi:hypothetical protein
MINKRTMPIEMLAVTNPNYSYFNHAFHDTFCSKAQSSVKTKFLHPNKPQQTRYFTELKKAAESKRYK